MTTTRVRPPHLLRGANPRHRKRPNVRVSNLTPLEPLASRPSHMARACACAGTTQTKLSLKITVGDVQAGDPILTSAPVEPPLTKENVVTRLEDGAAAVPGDLGRL